MDGDGGGGDGAGAGAGVLSDVEIILPGEIIESLGSLRPDSLSCFMSVDEKAQTTKQLFVHKLSDNSVRIRVTVMVLGSCNEKATDDKEAEGAGVETVHLRQNSRPATTVAAERSGIVSENGHQRTAVRRRLKPCVANPIHANKQLNKRLLTSFWRSKRKRAFVNRRLRGAVFSVRQKTPYTKSINNTKKNLGAAAVVAEAQNKRSITTDDSKSLMNRIESINADGATVVINAKLVEGDPKKPSDDDDDGFRGFDLLPGSSTVIILKTVVTPPRPSKTAVRSEAHGSAVTSSDGHPPRNEPTSAPRNYSSEERMDSSEKPKATSRDIAERLKARERKGVAPPQVSCELCGEVAETYVSLFRHIKKQHDDCTFVRNYLEEIEPLASTPCPVCRKPFMTAASLNAHMSSAHPDGRKSKPPQPSKLSAQRHHMAAEKRRAQTPPPSEDDSSEEEDEDAGPFACKVCGKQVEDVNKYRRHLLTHGEFRFPCEHCDKRFRMKDNLMKHVRRVHGKATDAAEHRPGPARPGPARPGPARPGPARPGPSRPGPAFPQGKTLPAVAKGGLFRCDHCRMTFNRTSLLVTHMRYCLKQKK